MKFKLVSEYEPTGDQPQAIDSIIKSIRRGRQCATLKGVTGSGKTFTMANVIARLNRPTLVLCHNKTLAAQLYSEFKNFFPDNAVEYYVSYYDYYQPEAYLPTTETYIEKDLSINEDIEKMRLSTTTTLLSGRRDVVVVASVSCIYGMGNPDDFKSHALKISKGDKITTIDIFDKLVEMHYTRTHGLMSSSTFRSNGDSFNIMSGFGEICYLVSHYGNIVTSIELVDSQTGIPYKKMKSATIYPANIFMTNKERLQSTMDTIRKDMANQVAAFELSGRPIEAQRLKQRVEHDLVMLKEVGYCSGIENYSRYFDGRKAGEPPFCLLNYFPKGFITIVDESHVTLPQVRAMYGGDSARKHNLVEYGFRLEAAKDNRPLNFEEFEGSVGKMLYVSATPGDYEEKRSEGHIIEQNIRPTGLINPPMKVRDTEFQIDDLLEEIDKTIRFGNKIMISAISKRLAEESARYLDKGSIRNRYIHCDVDTLDRVQILEDLRADKFDVLVGVNLLREGLDLPEVSLVAIFDADKNGFLRNWRSLTQMAGRAARNPRGEVILYGEEYSKAMTRSIAQSNKERLAQVQYNIANGIMPRQAIKSGTQPSLLLSKKSAEPQDVGVYNFSRNTPILKVAQPEYHTRWGGLDGVLPPREEPKEQYMRGVANYRTGDIVFTDGSLKSAKEVDIGAPRTIEEQIEMAREAMNVAAKAQNFKMAMAIRDRMYELKKELESEQERMRNPKKLLFK